MERESAQRTVNLRNASYIWVYSLGVPSDARCMKQDIQSTFVPIRRAASDLGVPITWLQSEAKAGRIPAIRAGRRWLVHFEQASQALTQMASLSNDGGGQ